jgi:hypothetical protein
MKETIRNNLNQKQATGKNKKPLVNVDAAAAAVLIMEKLNNSNPIRTNNESKHVPSSTVMASTNSSFSFLSLSDG